MQPTADPCFIYWHNKYTQTDSTTPKLLPCHGQQRVTNMASVQAPHMCARQSLFLIKTQQC